MRQSTGHSRARRLGWVALAVGCLLAAAPPLAWAVQAFQESAGQVVMEAENADANIARSGKTWTLETATTGYSGTGYLNALPNTGTATNTGYTTGSAELKFNVQFSTTGTYYVWVRGHAATTSDDSIHSGIDGSGPASADRIDIAEGTWTWSRTTMDSSAAATLSVTTAGVHTIHLWMREDGFKIDKLLLRTSSSSTAPSGTGPAQSARVTATDASPPSQPATPTEGSTSDADYDGDGAYTIYWTAASDVQSGISAYQLQERVGATGAWTTLTSTTTATSFAVTGKLHNTRYYYHVRARNGDGVWGSWSTDSDGVLVDTTIPIPPSVTDDGATTSSTTTLHATWAGASDPESGITEYRYRIRRDSNNGTIIRDYTSVGLATEVTATGLSLVNGVSYFIGIRAFNGAGLYESEYSDGILVTPDAAPPSGSVTINGGAAATNTLNVTLTLAATDDSGTVSQMRFSNDGTTYSTPEAYATTTTWALPTGDGTKTVYAQFVDPFGKWSAAATDTIVLDTTPPQVSFTSPQDGAVIIAPSL